MIMSNVVILPTFIHTNWDMGAVALHNYTIILLLMAAISNKRAWIRHTRRKSPQSERQSSLISDIRLVAFAYCSNALLVFIFIKMPWSQISNAVPGLLQERHTLKHEV